MWLSHTLTDGVPFMSWAWIWPKSFWLLFIHLPFWKMRQLLNWIKIWEVYWLQVHTFHRPCVPLFITSWLEMTSCWKMFGSPPHRACIFGKRLVGERCFDTALYVWLCSEAEVEATLELEATSHMDCITALHCRDGQCRNAVEINFSVCLSS